MCQDIILKLLYVVYQIKDYTQCKNGGHSTCPTFLVSVLKFIKYIKTLQATFQKCAFYVDILVQITYVKSYKNSKMTGSRTMGTLGARKWEKVISKMVSAACISLLCYSTTSKLLRSIVRNSGNTCVQ